MLLALSAFFSIQTRSCLFHSGLATCFWQESIIQMAFQVQVCVCERECLRVCVRACMRACVQACVRAHASEQAIAITLNFLLSNFTAYSYTWKLVHSQLQYEMWPAFEFTHQRLVAK